MSAIRREQGFTLIELLVAMALSMVLLGAVVLAFTAYDRHTYYDGQRIDAQNEGRLAVDRIARQLRNVASPITTPKLLERATAYDMVFQTVGSPSGGSGGNTSGVERVRYCIPADASGSASNEYLYAETQTWSTSTPASDPWSSDPTQTISCPDISLGQNETCPNSAGGTCSASAIANGVVNRYQGDTTEPGFTFTTGTAPNTSSSTSITNPTSTQTPISSVQINLLVNPNTSLLTTQPDLSKNTFQIQSSVFLRNQQLSPVASFSSTPTGSGNVVLNGGSSYSPDGDDLSYSWSCTYPSTCPNSAALAAMSTGLVTWSPGAGSYTVQLTVTDSTGLTNTTSQTVTVT